MYFFVPIAAQEIHQEDNTSRFNLSGMGFDAGKLNFSVIKYL